MTKIAYFSNQFATAKGHGIARYAHHLYKAMCQLSDAPNIIPVAAWSNREKQDLQALKQSTKLEILPWGRRITPLAWKYLGYPLIEHGVKTKIDAVHAVSLGYPIATRKPYIVTVHDIGPLTHPQFFTKKDNWLMHSSLRQAVRNAAALICVSQATADEVQNFSLKHYGQSVAEKIYISLEGVDSSFFEKYQVDSIPDYDKYKELLKRPFILTVGKISPRKNISRVLEAFNKVKDGVSQDLVMVGGNGWDFEEVNKKIVDLGLEKRTHFLGFVSDGLLKYLYAKASVFVYPSLFEGFGLTILEAMASGCPVITSNVSSLPEVAGNAALLINPEKSSALAEAIVEICTDESRQKELAIKGKVRASTFTWEKTARGVLKVYQDVI